jgi:purine-binding chemotaxis protein CheW
MDLVVFEIGGVRYALPAPAVREVVRAVTIVPLPDAPPIVEGLINVRGVLVPVLDVRTRFRIPANAGAVSDHLILAWAGTRLVALRVDRAVEVAAVDARDIENAKAVVPDANYVVGVAKLPDGLVLIHDLCTFLDDAERAALDTAFVAVTGGAP